MAMDNFPVPPQGNPPPPAPLPNGVTMTPSGDFNVPNASNLMPQKPLDSLGGFGGGSSPIPPNPLGAGPRPPTPYLPPDAPPSRAPTPNQYGRQPINPFAGGSPTPPQFAGQGVPNYPPPMRIPSGAPAAAAPAPNPNQYVSPLTQVQNGTLPTPSMVGATPQVPSAFIGKTPNYVSPAAQIQNGTLPRPSMVSAAPQVPSAFISKPPATLTATSALGQPVPSVNNYTPGAPRQLGQASITSDLRAKTDIVPATNPYDKILGRGGMDTSALDDAYAKQGKDVGSRFATPDTAWTPGSDLRPVKNYSYDYKDPHAPGAAPGRQLGGMAQEFATTPTLQHTVKPGPDGKLGVDTGRVAMALPGAIGETQSQVSKQQEQINTLASYIKSHMPPKPEAEVSQPPPEWSYKPTDYTSDIRAKTNVAPIDSGVVDPWAEARVKPSGTVADTSKEAQKRGGNADFVKQAIAAYRQALSQPIPAFAAPGVGDPSVASPYAESDIRAKKDIIPASFPTAAAAPTETPAEPVGTRERALAAGYAWLAAHGDQAAARHEQPAAPLPAESQMAAPGADKSMFPQGPTGIDAMQRSQFGLPTQDEADMAAIAADVERRKRTGQY